MNAALTSQYQYEANDLQVRRANYKILQLALVEAGYEEDRFAVLNPACQTNLLVMEKRKAQWVQVYLNALAAGVDLATFPDITTCELSVADDAELAGTFASLTTALTGANNDIVYTARQRGTAGNLLQVQYVDPAANNQALAVTVVGTLIRVSLATGVAGAITSTATLIRAAVSANAQANSLVSNALAASNTGAGVVTAMAATNLSGGTDA